MKKTFACLLLIFLVSSLLFLGSLRFSSAQTGMSVYGQVNSDTTWTQANNPYTLTGIVQVRSGVTLTIQPGVTVNLGTYSLQVNGTLVAAGTPTNQIYFKGNFQQRAPVAFSEASNSLIMLMSGSTGWNNQTGTGSIIKNAQITSTTLWITNSSTRISDNAFGGTMAYESIRIQGGAPTIYSNTFPSYCTITVSSGAPTIYGNIFTGKGYTTAINVQGSNPVIVDNSFSNLNSGVSVAESPDSIITDNTASNCVTAMAVDGAGTVVERNLVSNSQVGIAAGNAIILHNTIKDNIVGAYITSATTFSYNNLENNNNNTYCTGSTDVNASYNWWGTTDKTTISNTIYDNQDDFNLGTIKFAPFLTSPDLEAMPNQNLPIPTPNTSPPTSYEGTYTVTDQYGNTRQITANPNPSAAASPTQNLTATMHQPNTQTGGLFGLDIDKIVIILMAVIIGLLIVVIVLIHRKRS